MVPAISAESNDFDCIFNPKITKEKLLEFFNTQWLKKPSNLVITGPTVSKAHIGNTLCHGVILGGYPSGLS